MRIAVGGVARNTLQDAVLYRRQDGACIIAVAWAGALKGLLGGFCLDRTKRCAGKGERGADSGGDRCGKTSL